jgi:hypothetical protein
MRVEMHGSNAIFNVIINSFNVAVVKIVGLLQIFPSVLGKAMAFDNHA